MQDLASTQKSATDPEREWLEKTYRGGIKQLTVRAAIAGMFLGAVMCLSNLYVVLKTGWSFGVTLTASILGFALFRALRALRLSRAPLTLLENSAVSSVASSAGYMTGGGNMAALPALLLLTGMRPDAWALVAWFAIIAAMGVFAAIPIKRQLVNIEQLRFPTGTATAETIASMHAVGGKDPKAKILGWAGVTGAVVAWLRDAKATWMPFNLKATFPLPFTLAGHGAGEWTLAFEGSLILVGAGALMTWKTGWSLLLGAILTYAVLAPKMYVAGAIATVSYKGIVAYTLWPGAAMLVSSGILQFAFQWRSVARSFAGLARVFVRRGGSVASEDADPIVKVEVPSWWFPIGYMILSPFIVLLMMILFGIPWWAGLVAVPLSVAMGAVAARVTGETDTTPTKALGPVTQLVFGALVPGNMAANIMSANVTGGVGLHAADLLTDMKAGWLLGANPRQQLVAQLFGVVAGAAAVVPAFNLLVPTADVLGSAQFPAPSVLVWAGVSKVLVEGTSGLAPAARTGAALGAAVGVGLVLLERWAPKSFRAWVPSPSGLGIAMVIPGFNAIAIFTGALIAEVLRRRSPVFAERAVTPLASGLIAGESLMGITIAVLIALGMLTR